MGLHWLMELQEPLKLLGLGLMSLVGLLRSLILMGPIRLCSYWGRNVTACAVALHATAMELHSIMQFHISHIGPGSHMDIPSFTATIFAQVDHRSPRSPLNCSSAPVSYISLSCSINSCSFSSLVSPSCSRPESGQS